MVYDFGLRLRSLRLERKLTQAQVAKRIEVSKAAISGYENNVKTPSLEILKKLALFYGVSTDFLLGLKDSRVLPIDGLTQRQLEILDIPLREFKTR